MNINKILGKELERVKLESELENLRINTYKFVSDIEKEIKKLKIKADVFIGGSLAKNTIMKKDNYDVDIFVRFDKKYKDLEISRLLEKVLRKFSPLKIHGSRDYFKIISKEINFEIVPVIKISSPEQARNVTDLSFFHVDFIKKNTEKNKNLSDEILLAKSFAFSQGVYGAESYVNGFSGYALELLVSYYGSFVNFLKSITKKTKKIIIDPSKFYKSEKDVLENLNENKLNSPIVFVDPTFKHRNAVASLSYEAFEKFRDKADKFLKNPSLKFFEIKKVNPKKFNLIIDIYTDRQEGDIAGSKLLKFFNFFKFCLNKNFNIKGSEFEYLGGKRGKMYFKLEKKKEILVSGPFVSDIENIKKFKLNHKKTFIKNKKVYAKEKSLSVDEFIDKFDKDNSRRLREMGIVKFEVDN